MNFKTFILEASEKEKFNIGSTMEGVFAIAIGLYIAYRKIDGSKLEKYILNTEIKEREPTVIEITDHMERSSDVMSDVKDAAEEDPQLDPSDVSSENADLAVKVILDLMYKSTWEGFGGNKDKLVDTRDDIKKYEEVIKNLLDQVDTPQMEYVIGKIDNFIAEVLSKKSKEDVNFLVIADGKEGSVKKDSKSINVKGDVSLKIDVETKNGDEIIDVAPVTFSLKVDNITFANLSVFNAVLRLASRLGMDTFIEGIADIKTLPRIGAYQFKYFIEDLENKNPELKAKKEDPNHIFYWMSKTDDMIISNKSFEKLLSVDMMNHFVGLMKEKISTDKSSEMIKRLFDFLKDEIHGDDSSDVIKLSHKDKMKTLKIGELENIAQDLIKRNFEIEAKYQEPDYGSGGVKCELVIAFLDNEETYDQINFIKKNLKSVSKVLKLKEKLGEEIRTSIDTNIGEVEISSGESEPLPQGEQPVIEVKKKAKPPTPAMSVYKIGDSEYGFFLFEESGESDPQGYLNIYGISPTDEIDKLFHLRKKGDTIALEVDDYIYNHPANM